MTYPKRKHPRLKNYDYSQNGFYYVTIHIASNGERLSEILYDPNENTAKEYLTDTGKIAYAQLLALESRFPYVRVDKYVIMPTHIHMILEFCNQPAGASPRPTLPDVVGAFKSLTTRACNKHFDTPGRKLFQESFYEAVLRSDADYQARWTYIDENPLKWSLDPEDL